MNKVKILHCGDLHFDTPFKELSKEISEVSKEELLEVFKKIIDITIEENVQILLIAGDVFDNLSVNKNTLFFIANEINRINNVHVFISPGNHDPYGEKSFYKLIKWPDNVHIFKGKMEAVEVKALNCVIWGAGFGQAYENETLLTKVSTDSSKINIMLLHGEIVSGTNKNEYNPININDIKESNIDYIALGHRHNFSEILREGKTDYAYCGCPQGRGFDEVGEKGIIIGDVFCGGTLLDFISTCKRKYIASEIDITECNTYDDIITKVLNKFSIEERKKNLYKIILCGEVKEYLNLNGKILFEKIREQFYFVKLIDKTNISIDIEELSMDFSIKGKFVKNILETMQDFSDDEQEIINMALKIGIQCLSQEEVDLSDY